VGELVAVIQKNDNALQSQIHAIAEMYSLKAASWVVRGDFPAMFSKYSMSWSLSVG
jgi:hypothetical protein